MKNRPTPDELRAAARVAGNPLFLEYGQRPDEALRLYEAADRLERREARRARLVALSRRVARRG